MSNPATPKQVAFINDLASDLREDHGNREIVTDYLAKKGGAAGLNKPTASEVITRLLALREAEQKEDELNALAEQQAEGAWLRHAENQYDPDTERELAEHDRNWDAEMQRMEREEEVRRCEHKMAEWNRAEADELGRTLGEDLIPPVTNPFEKKPGRFLTTAEFPALPAGRYAVTGEDGTTDFYKVDHGKNRWAGTLFVKLHVAGREDTNLRGPNARTIANKIMADGPMAASIRYGHELGHCGVCGRELTNPDSIAAGIGPVCATKAGW